MRARERRILPLLLPLLLLWGCAGREEAAPAPTEEPEESAKEIAEESVPMLTWGQYSTPADAQELQLAGEDISLRELRSLLEQMTAAPALVELGEQSYDAGELAPLCADYPLTRFVCAVELFGQSFASESAELDLSEVPMTDTKELEAALCCFPALEKVLMLHCGLDNDTMDALNARHEGVNFVWMVCAYHWLIRTDITAFIRFNQTVPCPGGSGGPGELRYCTELVALDLGHIAPQDTSFLLNMKKLRYLILADGAISDLSYIGQLPELEYFEAFKTPISDLSPLLNCKKLKYLNICRCDQLTEDSIDVLCRMPQLERLWFYCHYLDNSYEDVLLEALPSCEIYYHNYRSGLEGSTEHGWREHESYFAMRDALGMPYMAG